MNSQKFVYLEQFLYPAINILTPLWPVIRPILRLATALTAATVTFQFTAIEGLGIWLALGAGLMSWNFLFKAPPGFAKAIDQMGATHTDGDVVSKVQDDPVVVSPTYDDHPANNWYDPSRD